MISKIDMSIWTSVSAPCGTVSSTLLTRVPTVWRYVSWYSLRTKRRISEVFPTPPSPMRASFAFMRRTVGIGIGRAPHPEPGYKQFRRVDRRTPVTERRYRPGPVHDRSADKCSSPADDFDRLQSFDRARTALNYHVRVGAFYVPRIGISTNIDAFIPPAGHVIVMRFRPEGPRIPVPNWLIEWSKSRDLFLSLAHDPWVFRPN